MCVQDDNTQQRARVGADMGNALGMWIRHVLAAVATPVRSPDVSCSCLCRYSRHEIRERTKAAGMGAT